MATPMAPNYACIFMTKFETRIYPAPPYVAFKRPKSSRNHLVRSLLASLTSDEANKCTLKCGRCKICKLLSSSKEISNSKVKNTTLKIKHYDTCSSLNLIYAVRCTKCNCLYIGQTGDRLQDRMSKHKYDIRKWPENSELAEQLHLNHEPKKHMEVFILQTGLKTEVEREFFEDRRICHVQTL